MPAVTSYTRVLTPTQVDKLRTILDDRGFATAPPKPHALFSASKDKTNITVYAKGPKVLVQGKGTEDFVRFLLEPEVLGTAELGYESELFPDRFEPHFGIDESGKGDFFGPLVIAGVYSNRPIAEALAAAGVADSKKIGSDARIRKLAAAIRQTPGAISEVVRIGPARYNELYASFGNLNRLLAWGHAKVIESLALRQPDCPRALSDQFANPAVLKRALLSKNLTVTLDQRTKAESDPAVAAASILAREAFIDWMRDAGADLEPGDPLPKGASALVKARARQLVAAHGPEILPRVAKTHFKTAAEVLANA